MNSLSWMIYLADLTGALSGLFAFVAIAAFIASAGAAVTWLTTGETVSVYSYEDRVIKQAAHDVYRAKVASLIRPSGYVFAGFAAMAAILPSSGTIYAIAASELGETALNSETGGKAIKALDAWLDRQIAGEAEGSK
jgi:hypothetical protein